MGYEHDMMWYGDDTDTVVRENLKRRYFSESHYVSLSLKIKLSATNLSFSLFLTILLYYYAIKFRYVYIQVSKKNMIFQTLKD